MTTRPQRRPSSPSRGQVPVSGVRPRSTSARDECFHGDAGASPHVRLACAPDEQRRRRVVVRWLLLRPRLRARPRQQRRRSQGAARPPTWARGEPLLSPPRGYSCRTRPETRTARKAAPCLRLPGHKHRWPPRAGRPLSGQPRCTRPRLLPRCTRPRRSQRTRRYGTEAFGHWMLRTVPKRMSPDETLRHEMRA
jgi:hypothetical protein